MDPSVCAYDRIKLEETEPRSFFGAEDHLRTGKKPQDPEVTALAARDALVRKKDPSAFLHRLGPSRIHCTDQHFVGNGASGA